jgi:hypothetical protein
MGRNLQRVLVTQRSRRNQQAALTSTRKRRRIKRTKTKRRRRRRKRRRTRRIRKIRRRTKSATRVPQPLLEMTVIEHQNINLTVQSIINILHFIPNY